MGVIRPLSALVLSCSFASVTSLASTIAVIDSGLDTLHKDLKERVWLNPGDNSVDRKDNDNNGFTDDVHGWNYINNNGSLIDYKYTKLYATDLEKFFELQGKAVKGEASQSEVEWMKAQAADQEFLKKLQTFGNFVHGTHVTGIVVRNNPEARALGIKLIPTENPLAGVKKDIEQASAEGKDPNWIVKRIVKAGLGLFAKLQGLPFGEVGKYIGQNQVDVANASLGIGKTQAEMLIKPLLKLANRGQEPSAELLREMVLHFLTRANIEQTSIINNAPGTLFVFAAGNEGISNDEYPSSPASIDHPAKISVAASFDDGRLATFSNYGMAVDVAAPGVTIQSTIPDQRYLALSGTSQAAPFVAGVAAEIKDNNAKLDAVAIKKIIVETVDFVDSLKGKIASGGVVNSKRAIRAAQLSNEQSLDQAIASARDEVADLIKADVFRDNSRSIWIDPMLMSVN